MAGCITAIEIVRQSQQGYSIKPFIVRADDGNTYFVKGHAKAGGPALISEVLGAELGVRIGLPIPPWKLMEIPEDLIRFSVAPDVEDLSGSYAFASLAVTNASDFSVSRLAHTPAETMRRVLLFDWWLRNGDRCLGENGGNVNLIVDPTGELVVIDHNLTFDLTFDGDDFLDSHVFRGRRTDFRDLVTRQEYSQILRSAIADWDTITALLPDDWLYRDRDHIDLTQPTLAQRLEILEMFTDERFWGPL